MQLPLAEAPRPMFTEVAEYTPTFEDTDCYAAPISNLDSALCASLNSDELLTR